MKKIMKFALILVGGLVGLIVLFFLGVFLVNQFSLKSEAKKIVPYGEKITVGEHQLNVEVVGEGPETVVLLPGYLTASPVLDFSELTAHLAKTHRVVVIEPFGYGLSDLTEAPRTLANITSEIHEALQGLEIEKYTLMGHSLAGIYSLAYLNQYPDEVEAFVGIDSSVPNQPGGEDTQGPSLRWLSKSGVYRLLGKVDDSLFGTPPFLSEALQEQYRFISLKNLGSETLVSEAENMKANFEGTQALSFPANLPVLYLLASEDEDNLAEWVELHEEMLVDLDKSQLELLAGSHYLHHTHAEEITKTYLEFMAK